MQRLLAVSLLLAGCGGAPPPPAPPPSSAPVPPPAEPVPYALTATPLAVSFVDSPTAQVFHAVDQLSAWYPDAHTQYAAWAKTAMPLDDAERDMLARHAALRRRWRWGALDQAFGVQVSLDEAVSLATEKRLLPPADADEEKATLAHFAERLAPLLASQRGAIEDVRRGAVLALKKAAPLFAGLGRLCDSTDPVRVRVVLAANPVPEEGEAAAAGAVLVVEVPSGAGSADETVATLLHALGHALLSQRRGTITTAAEKCEEPVDDVTVEEGLAYAFAPGLVHDDGTDPLADTVKEDASRSLRDPRVRGERLGLALRGALGEALATEHPKIEAFLPKACDAWAKVAKE